MKFSKVNHPGSQILTHLYDVCRIHLKLKWHMLPIKRENRGYLVIWYHLVMIQHKWKIRQQKDNWEIKSSAWYNCYLPISWKDTYADDVKGYNTIFKNFIHIYSNSTNFRLSTVFHNFQN